MSLLKRKMELFTVEDYCILNFKNMVILQQLECSECLIRVVQWMSKGIECGISTFLRNPVT